MVSVKARYENGKLHLLEPLEGLNDGDEITIHIDPARAELLQKQKDSLKQSRGLWADWDEIDDYFADSHQKWDEEWLAKTSKLNDE